MKNMKWKSLSILCSIILAIVQIEPCKADTNHTGAISSGETWTTAGNVHHLTGDTTLNNGVTLTIDAGVEIQTNSSAYQLIIEGKLYAVGTRSNLIRFHSNVADELISSAGYLQINNSDAGTDVEYWYFYAGYGLLVSASVTVNGTFKYLLMIDCYYAFYIQSATIMSYIYARKTHGSTAYTTYSNNSGNTVSYLHLDDYGPMRYASADYTNFTFDRLYCSYGYFGAFVKTLTISNSIISSVGIATSLAMDASNTSYVTRNIFKHLGGGTNIALIQTNDRGISSYNDIYDYSSWGISEGYSSDNDYLSGNRNYVKGIVDTTNTFSGNQYNSLATARTNARSEPNFPLTITAETVSYPGEGEVTITWNTGCPADSLVLVREGTGTTIKVGDKSTYDFASDRRDYDWSTMKYALEGLDVGTYKDNVANGMIGVCHTITMTKLKKGTQYSYLVVSHAPWGDQLTGATQGTFTTTGSAGGGESSYAYIQ
jgi:hypothetical protein